MVDSAPVPVHTMAGVGLGALAEGATLIGLTSLGMLGRRAGLPLTAMLAAVAAVVALALDAIGGSLATSIGGRWRSHWDRKRRPARARRVVRSAR